MNEETEVKDDVKATEPPKEKKRLDPDNVREVWAVYEESKVATDGKSAEEIWNDALSMMARYLERADEMPNSLLTIYRDVVVLGERLGYEFNVSADAIKQGVDLAIRMNLIKACRPDREFALETSAQLVDFASSEEVVKANALKHSSISKEEIQAFTELMRLLRDL